MRAREVFMEGLIAHGVSAIFGNPGTTENPLLESLLDYPDLPYYVALHEGVAACAASFHALATNKPSVVNVHVAPGLGNAIGMVFGALKAHAPLLVTAGQQDTRLRLRDPLLSHDLVGMARPVCKWAAEPAHPDELAPLLREALYVAMTPPRGPVFLSLPVNVLAGETDVTNAAPTAHPTVGVATEAQLEEATTLLGNARNPALLVGDDVVTYGAYDDAVALAERSGASVYTEALRVHTCFPNRHPAFAHRMPLEAERIRGVLANHDLLVFIGGQFFEELWYDEGAVLPEGIPVLQIEQYGERLGRIGATTCAIAADLPLTLQAINANLPTAAAASLGGMRDDDAARLERQRSARPMTALHAMSELAAALPDDAVIVDESITAYPDVAAAFAFDRPHTYYAGRGGGIGQGLAGAIGVQAAHPDRRVVAISGDGSAMYSEQALWSAAHHQLPILFVILANEEYRVLKHNLDIYRARYEAANNRPYPHMDLVDPVINFVGLANAHGIPGKTVSEPGDIADAVSEALNRPGPSLIELRIAGKQ